MSRHGWVVPLPGGAVARCGGPGMCGHCMAERIVNRGCPTTKSGGCYYCGSDLDARGAQHTEGCIWPPFAEKFS